MAWTSLSFYSHECSLVSDGRMAIYRIFRAWSSMEFFELLLFEI